MSVTQQGKVKCDRCDEVLVSGGLGECVIAADVGDDGMVINYHFCRANECDGKVLTKRNLSGRIGRSQNTGMSTPGK